MMEGNKGEKGSLLSQMQKLGSVTRIDLAPIVTIAVFSSTPLEGWLMSSVTHAAGFLQNPEPPTLCTGRLEAEKMRPS